MCQPPLKSHSLSTTNNRLTCNRVTPSVAVQIPTDFSMCYSEYSVAQFSEALHGTVQMPTGFHVYSIFRTCSQKSHFAHFHFHIQFLPAKISSSSSSSWSWRKWLHKLQEPDGQSEDTVRTILTPSTSGKKNHWKRLGFHKVTAILLRSIKYHHHHHDGHGENDCVSYKRLIVDPKVRFEPSSYLLQAEKKSLKRAEFP